MNKLLFKLFALGAVILISTKSFAQIKVGDNPNTIKSTSLFEMESTTKGLLMPRLTQLQVDALTITADADDAVGLLVYNLDEGCVQHFDTAGSGSFSCISTDAMTYSDSTFILQDSILVAYQNGVEINRDTIRFPERTFLYDQCYAESEFDLNNLTGGFSQQSSPIVFASTFTPDKDMTLESVTFQLLNLVPVSLNPQVQLRQGADYNGTLLYTSPTVALGASANTQLEFDMGSQALTAGQTYTLRVAGTNVSNLRYFRFLFDTNPLIGSINTSNILNSNTPRIRIQGGVSETTYNVSTFDVDGVITAFAVNINDETDRPDISGGIPFTWSECIVETYRDSSALLQDSILVSYQNGTEINRDTVRISNPTVTTYNDNSVLLQDSILVSYQNGMEINRDTVRISIPTVTTYNDSTALLQDSILVAYQNGVEINRDTIGLPKSIAQYYPTDEVTCHQINIPNGGLAGQNVNQTQNPINIPVSTRIEFTPAYDMTATGFFFSVTGVLGTFTIREASTGTSILTDNAGNPANITYNSSLPATSGYAVNGVRRAVLSKGVKYYIQATGSGSYRTLPDTASNAETSLMVPNQPNVGLGLRLVGTGQGSNTVTKWTNGLKTEYRNQDGTIIPSVTATGWTLVDCDTVTTYNDNTILLQDSILVAYQNGTEVNRDTVRVIFPTSTILSTGSLAAATTGTVTIPTTQGGKTLVDVSFKLDGGSSSFYDSMYDGTNGFNASINFSTGTISINNRIGQFALARDYRVVATYK